MPTLLEIDQERENLADHWLPPSGDPLAIDYEAYLRLRDDTAADMVARSKDRLLEWVESLPASQTANDRLDEFIVKTFRRERMPSGFAALQSAIAEKRGAYNPDRYHRPDISLALIRQHYGEMNYRGLEPLAYLTTMLRKIQTQCPAEIAGISADNVRRLDRFVKHGSLDARERMMRGEVESKAEAERAFLIRLVEVFASPGCHVTMFGYLTQCVSEEEFADTMEALMTSNPAIWDSRKLMAGGCTGITHQFMENLVEFASTDPYTHYPALFQVSVSWEFVGGG